MKPLPEKLEEFSRIKTAREEDLEIHACVLDILLETLREIRYISQIPENERNQTLNAILSSNFAYFVDSEEVCISSTFEFWSNGFARYSFPKILENSIQEIAEETPGFYRICVAFDRNADGVFEDFCRDATSPPGFGIEGMNKIDLFYFLKRIIINQLSKYQGYTEDRIDEYEDFFATAKAIIKSKKDLHTRYSKCVSAFEESVDPNTIRALWPLMY